MLKTIRVLVALVSIVLVTLLFVDFTGFAREHWAWLAQIQLVPAVLSVNLIALVILVALVLIFGRIYCSVICPLGIMQDVIHRLRLMLSGSRKRRIGFTAYTPAHNRVRAAVLIAFLILLFLGLTTVLASTLAGLVEPYSAYGRIASQIFAPAYDGINNMLADVAVSHDSYLFYHVPIVTTTALLIVAIATVLFVGLIAWFGARDYCNTICPVGTLLGFFSRYSLLRITIDKSKCVGCKRCERHCKSSCIDSMHHSVDYSRCVVCMDCINKCKEGAISYTWRRPVTAPAVDKTQNAPVNASRRALMTAGALVAGASLVHAAEKIADGGLAPLKDKRQPDRKTPIVPPGAVSLKHLSQHCTACQLCVAACPEHIIVPDTSLDRFMQPTIDYTRGFCRPNCTACSDACPTGAFHRIDVAEKSSVKIGSAHLNRHACISHHGEKCGNCERHCPAGAITLTPMGKKKHLTPVVNDAMCIGCGACEFYCPVGSVESIPSATSAIYVRGIEVHRQI